MNGKRATASTLLHVSVLVLLTLAAAGNSFELSPHNQSIVFTENLGQWDNQVRFRAATGGVTVWLSNDGILYALSRSTGQRPEPRVEARKALKSDPAEEMEDLLFGIKFLGSNPRPEVYGVSKKDFHSNYFLGNDASRWKSSVPSFDTVVYLGIYPGIDMKYYADDAGIEYTFVVAPGADPSAIRLRYEGVISLSADQKSELRISTAWGTLDEKLPAIYQVIDGKKINVGGSFDVGNDGSFGFAIGKDFDRSAELIIDPVLTFSSYLGGSGAQYPSEIKEDALGNILVLGHTRSLDYPTAGDPYQAVYGGGEFDAVLTKISRLTSQIVYSTYIGGSMRDEEPRLVFGSQGDMYITGRTYSPDFPTVNPFQSTLSGSDDSFVLRLNAAGNQLLYSTYLGGGKEEDLSRIAVDDQGYIYVCGITTSYDFPTMNPISPEQTGGQYDGYMTKFYPAGDALVYSTYLGGHGDEEFQGLGVTSAGEAVVAGFTYSDDYPVANALYECQINPDGPIDAIITKFSSDGSSLVFSTYLGGTEDEWFEDLVLDASGNIYLVGSMESLDFEMVNAIQPVHCVITGDTWGSDIFVAVMNGSGNELLFTTFLCGSMNDWGTSIDLGPDGSIYVCGITESADFEVSSPIQGTMNGESDMVVARISPDRSRMIYATYFGGSDDEFKTHLGAGSDECVHVTGSTFSDDISMVNATQPVSRANYDIFLATISGGCCLGDRGNFDGDVDDELNVADVVAMANWAYKGGPMAPCLDEADIDADGKVTLYDLLLLVYYFYRGGPAPPSCQ